tara:strand:+ start:14600 stop:16717 length:2118 start_codon:yes stop_codon:yes gene_type:complete
MKNIDWLNKCYTRSYISQHYGDWDKRIFKDYDINEILRILEETDPEFLLVTARSHNGKWFCDVSFGDKHRGLGEVDQVAAVIDRFREKGKPVVAYFSAVYDQELYERHPDWKQVNADGHPVGDGDNKSWGKTVCLNSPYREYLTEMIRELLATHELDGVFFDMTFFDVEPCYCQYCKRAFRSIYGSKLPAKDWNSQLYRDYIQFRIDTNYTFIKDICDAVKSANPSASTGIQYRLMYDNLTMTGQSLKAGAVPDYLYFDPYIEHGFLKASVCTRLVAQVSRNMPEISLMVRPGKHTDNPNMKPLAHLKMDAFTAIANGGSVQLFDVMMPNGTLHQPMWKRIGEVFREVEKREPWLGGEHVKSVALHYSENSRLWYGRDDPLERYDNHFFGWARAMLEEQIPFVPICGLSAEELDGYQVLVLPNAACLSPAEVEAVEQFVRKGGGLVTNGKTSLYDETGKYLRNYGLADVLGIDHYGDTSAYSRVYSRFETATKIGRRQAEDGLVSSWGTVEKCTPREGAEVIATLVYPLLEATGKRFVNIQVNPPAVETEVPACVQHTYGDGRTVYFPGSLDVDYLKLSFPELKWLMIDAVRSVASDGLEIEMQAPACIEMTAFNQDDRLVVHMVNSQPEIGKPVSYGYGQLESRHIISETLPVHNLQVRVRDAGKFSKATLQPEGKALDITTEDGFLVVQVAQVTDHNMVVFEP